MKLLILGASGFIGSCCLKHFSGKHAVTGVDVVSNGSNLILVDTDFSLTQTLIANNQFDAIINCAGSSNVLASFADPATDFSLNTAYVQNVLSGVKKNSSSTRFINISSASVYGNPATLPVHESSSESPLSPYAFHKLLSEKIISQYAQLFGTKALSVRIFSAYGPGLRKQFFFDLYNKFRSNPEMVSLAGTGNESRDFIYISDIAEAFDILIKHADFNGSVYNLGHEEESFISPTAQLFADICGFKGSISFTQEQFAGYPLNWKADTTKLRALGFSPKVNLKEGLENYYNWLINNPGA